MSFVAMIPARYASTRLPGKPLADIEGTPMVGHAVSRVLQSGAAQVIVVTDHSGVAKAAKDAGAEACMTSSHHSSGTERLAEATEQYGFADETVIVNVQGDEPLLPPLNIRQVARNLESSEADMSTLAVPIETAEDAFNPNVVKVVVDARSHALYFSRAPIPWDRERFGRPERSVTDGLLRHVGIYAYRAGFLRRYVGWAPTPLEQVELLEQLRVLWYGGKIHVAVAEAVPPAGVDTPEDLQRVRDRFKAAKVAS